MSEVEQTTAAPSAPAETWRDELASFWRAMPLKGLFFSLFIVWAGLFHLVGNSTLGYVETSSLFGWLHWVYSVSPDEAHGQLVPFVVLGLFWWKRKELMAVPKQAWWPALGLVILALVFHILGYLIQQARLSVLGFFVGLYGLMGLVWGKAWLKACFFPYFLLAFCMPLGTLAESVTFPLRLLVTQFSVGISSLGLGIEVYREGTQIFGAQGFQYDVAPACSGIRSLIALLALTTIYGFMNFRALWKRLLMMALAFPLAVAGNVVRITTVIIVAEAFGEDAGATIEQKLGFVTFLVALIGIVAVGYWIRDRENDLIGNPNQWEGQTA